LEARHSNIAADLRTVSTLQIGYVNGWSEAEAWETLCRLIIIQFSVKRHKITPEARLVTDLGLD
jgi:hypothetical protein